MTTTAPATRREALDAGWVEIGVWGYGRRDAGGIFARAGDAKAVLAAYEAIDDDAGDADSALDDTRDAGGVYISDRPAAK